jgi:hypothetical protein
MVHSFYFELKRESQNSCQSYIALLSIWTQQSKTFIDFI